MPSPEQALQREYYAATAREYDGAHVRRGDEHHFSLAFMVGILEFLQARSVLEIGSGTGRGLQYLATHAPSVHRLGVEPVRELREVAYQKGVARDQLIDGDACHLPLQDGAFDVVCEFGVLHHIRDHAAAVREMLRVANKAVLISDGNSFGQGSRPLRAIKQSLRAMRLWSLADLLKTRGRGYTVTEGDGLAYSYSVFSDYQLVRSECRSVHVLNTLDAGIDPYRTASHVALLGIK